jgi:hypothetical protein
MVLAMLVLGQARNRQVGLGSALSRTGLESKLTCTCGHVL